MKKIKILIAILSILLIGISYYIVTDTESKLPKETEKKCTINQYDYMERNIFVIKPENKKTTEKTILYFHGGAYMAEASRKHWDFLSKLANDAQVEIIMPDYPLTPKHNYKDVYEMLVPFYKELIKKVDTSKLIIMGDSAGGGISLALQEKIAEENIEMPAKTIVISPWLDVRLENPEIEKYEEKDKQLNKDQLKLAGIIYAANDDINNYLINPIEGDISKLKNITILIGTNDILNPDVKLLKQKAEKQGMRRTNTNKRIRKCSTYMDNRKK